MKIIKSKLLGFAFWLYSFLPLKYAKIFGCLFGKLLIILRKKDYEVATSQLKFALNIDRRQAEKLANKNFSKMGSLTAEAFKIPEILQTNNSLKSQELALSNFILEEDSEQILTTGRGNGSIVLSGHIGCIELLAAYYVARGLDLWAIGRSPNQEWFSKWLEELRLNYNVKSIWREESNAGIKIFKALKSGGTITALIDQDTKLENDFAKFFGLKAASPSSLIRLALKKNIPIFSCFIASLDGSKYLIRSKILTTGKSSLSTHEILNLYNQELEKMIHRYPTQWVWWHKRWRRRPFEDYKGNPNLLKNSSDYCEWISNKAIKNNLKSHEVEKPIDKKRILV